MNAPGRHASHYDGPTYYDQPAVKESKFGWTVALYTFVGGMAGAAQIIATIAGLRGDGRFDRIRRLAPRIGAAASAAGAAILVRDLGTPGRFYNMLRIFRPTSAMSIGSYTLTAFGGATGVAALASLISPRAHPGPVARAAEWGAAASGAGMATYTAGFLAATSTPLWAATPRLLGAEFACGAMASGAALLSLLDPSSRRALDRVAAIATLARASVVGVATAERKRAGADGGLSETQWGAVHALGSALAVGLPLVCYGLDALRGPSRRRSTVAALGILAGTFLSRWALFEGGNASARRPRDYFRMTSGEVRE